MKETKRYKKMPDLDGYTRLYVALKKMDLGGRTMAPLTGIGHLPRWREWGFNVIAVAGAGKAKHLYIDNRDISKPLPPKKRKDQRPARQAVPAAEPIKGGQQDLFEEANAVRQANIGSALRAMSQQLWDTMVALESLHKALGLEFKLGREDK